MKAVIIAGGLGQRLKPFTQIIPKPLLPLGKSSVLETQILSLKKCGIKDVIIATNYLSDYVRAFLDGKNYYDNWGNRVYAFYNDKNNIMLNFQAAKELGADYIISRFPIKNNELKIVCYKCNNSNHLFLYKIL